ncbi:heme transporter FLVCR2-like isoform X2 [Phymastichus coffea]|nr:heme transporter FLVCR2-like isoform X2 [Phymastichus coffea]
MAVKATAMIYSASFVVFLYPVTWLIHKRGLRFVCVIASASVCLGTWIKYFAIAPDQFSLILIGQCFVGAWQVVCSSLPATLAAVWFGPNEVATAMALAGSGTVIGVAVSSIVSPIIVRNHGEPGDIGKNLNHYILPIAFYCTCVLFLMLFFFSEGPKLPPSKARALQKLCLGEDLEFFKKIRRLLKNRNYIFLWNAHGLVGGAMICVNVSLNTLYMRHFEHGEKDTGRMGLLIILSGYCGAVIFCRLVDRYKIFKLILVILYAANILTTILFGIAMYFEVQWTVYVAIGLYGFFTHGYFTTAYETCAELTYPEPVTISVTILNLANQLYSAIFVACLDQILISYSDVAAYAFLTLVSIIGFILTCVTRDERKRQHAGKLG